GRLRCSLQCRVHGAPIGARVSRSREIGPRPTFAVPASSAPVHFARRDRPGRSGRALRPHLPAGSSGLWPGPELHAVQSAAARSPDVHRPGQLRDPSPRPRFPERPVGHRSLHAPGPACHGCHRPRPGVAGQSPFPGVGLFRSALYIPHIVSLTAVSMIWLWMYSQNGLFNDMLELVNLGPQRWLNDAETALNGVSVMRIWKALGSNMVLLLAGLQTIPRDLYEAASIDGANRWHQFRYVTLPGLRPMLVYVVAMDIIYLSQSFAEIFVLTSGGP